MNSEYDKYYGTTKFDNELSLIPHFTLYPEMKPWIGNNYGHGSPKILILGESYYFNEDKAPHLDDEKWYSRSHGDTLDTRRGHRVRYHISNAIDVSFKGGTHQIHQRINKNLLASKVNWLDKLPYNSIAYLNFFQRPALNKGKDSKEKRGLKATALDQEVAAKTISQTINIINPDLVLFASVLAYNVAMTKGVLKGTMTKHNYSPHPCTKWWSQNVKKYGKFKNENMGPITGKRRFLEVLNQMV